MPSTRPATARSVSPYWVTTASCPAPPPARDSNPPSTPSGLAVRESTTTSVSLAWAASTDDVAVQGYGVSVDGTRVHTVDQPGTVVSGLGCGTAYAFGVDAYDAAGNRSAAATVAAATAACPQSSDTQPPSKPLLSLGARTATSLVLQWQPGIDNVGVHHYNVFRGASPAVAGQVKVAETTTLSHTFTGLTCGTDYSLALEVADAAGNKSLLAEAIWYPARTLDCVPPPAPSLPVGDTTPPTQPGSLAVGAAAATSVSLTWTSASDAVGVTGYGVYRNGTFVKSVSQPGTTVSALACGTGYTFEVDAFDAAGNRSTRAAVTSSTSACADTQAPTVPANVTATSRTTTSIALSWSASSDNVGVTGYGLYRAGSLVGTATGTTGIFSGLACNANHTLSVDAFDAAGNRSPAATVMVATMACPDTAAPSKPSNFAATNVTRTGLTLTWTASTDNVGVTGYDVYRNGAKVASPTSASAGQTGLSCGTSYTFEVDAGDVAGNRSSRAVLTTSTSACTTTPPPPPPTLGAIPAYSEVGAKGPLTDHPGGVLSNVSLSNRRFIGKVTFGAGDVTCNNCEFAGGIETTYPNHGKITLSNCTNRHGWWFEDGGHNNVWLDHCLFEYSPKQAIRPSGPGTIHAVDSWFRSFGQAADGVHTEAMQMLSGATADFTRSAFSQNPVTNNTVTAVIHIGSGNGTFTDCVFGNYTPSTGVWSRGGGYYMIYPDQAGFIRPTIYSANGTAQNSWYNGVLPVSLVGPTYIAG